MATLKQHTKRLLDMMPVGVALEHKYDPSTNQYKFWQAIAMYYVLLEDDINTLKKELGASTTEQLISRWELDFGIPDDYFDIADTLEERRSNLLLKKGGLNLLNIDDFRELAERLGYELTISTTTDVRYPPYDVPFYPFDDIGAFYTVIISGDFTGQDLDSLIAFFGSLVPITVAILAIDTGP